MFISNLFFIILVLKEKLAQIVEEQKKRPMKKDIITRDVDVKTTSQITIVSGIRRCGKSTLLKELLNRTQKYDFITFEDLRLMDFTLNDFLKLEEIFKTNIYFFDEIQNIRDWEVYVRTAHDDGKRIYITGSNASMLSRELGTKLTGRYKLVELFPFSYIEYLRYTKKKASNKTFYSYLEDGGFPEYLKEKDPEYLQRLLENILARDIIVRKRIKNESVILSLARYIISNVGKVFSYNKISKHLGIKSVRTTIDYCQYLQESYLIELIPNYSLSISKQMFNPKKAYAIDTALIKANSLSFSEDIGRILENAVYLQLRRKYREIFYFNEKGECDFVIKDKDSIIFCIQVCYKIDSDNISREISGLKQAMKSCKCKKGLIITLDQEDEIDGIKLIPAWKFFIKRLH